MRSWRSGPLLLGSCPFLPGAIFQAFPPGRCAANAARRTTEIERVLGLGWRAQAVVSFAHRRRQSPGDFLTVCVRR